MLRINSSHQFFHIHRPWRVIIRYNSAKLNQSHRRSDMWIAHQVNSFLNLGICKEYLFMAKKPTFRSNPARTEEHVSNSNPPTNEVMMSSPASSGTLEVPQTKSDSKKPRTKKTAAG